MRRASVSSKIVALRRAAGRTSSACPTCGREADAPFRVFDARGKVVHGCVDACHEGRLVAGTESARWHARPEAEAIRRAEYARLSA